MGHGFTPDNGTANAARIRAETIAYPPQISVGVSLLAIAVDQILLS
jgi:hypothetical protein